MPSNIDEYRAQMKVNQALALTACEKTINATVLEMAKKIVDRTPVGNPELWHPPKWPANYTPGQLKASWKIRFSEGEQAVNDAIKGHGIGLTVHGTTHLVSIYNTQPYAERIEYGSWSTQAPAGMMRITVAEYTGILYHNVAKYRIK